MQRTVEVAVDAPGVPGGRAYTYEARGPLHDLLPGEAVLVPYGRRNAVGIVLDDAQERPERELKDVLARIRTDGPLVHPLQVRLTRWISEHYLAPPALVLQQMLPPGLLERLTLVAHASADGATGGDDHDESLLALIVAAGERGISLDEMRGPRSRPEVLRRLRTLQRAGKVRLEWEIRPGDARPRLERHVRLTDAGRAAASDGGQASGPERSGARGQRLGPRQAAVLRELGDEEAWVGESVSMPARPLGVRHGTSAVTSLVRRGLVELELVPVRRRPLAGRLPGQRGTRPHEAALTLAQASVVARLTSLTEGREHATVLLDGPTGAGKTAIYAAAIAAALRAGRAAVVLVPEIALALPLVDRLRRELDTEPAILHSGLSDGERADEWRRIRSGEARLVVGTRLAILAPLRDPGLVIVDEEHAPAYKSDRTPRYQARDVALEVGRLAGAPVVLGSATPDVATYGRARMGVTEHVRLETRLAGRPPSVELVDLRAELAARNTGLLSRTLVAVLRALDRSAGERAILVINRRGSASVVLCRDCGYVQVCPECRRPLVFHASAVALRCHHCGASAPPARRCPACGSPRIRYLGGGTERVEREVLIRFPDYRVGRLDRDVAERRGEAARVIDAFADGELDVLVGTTLAAKALDIPQVTLVGVVSADVALNLPDERAAERTFQFLVQAIGRAGRGERPGHAVVQTYQPDHPAVRAAVTGDHATFYEAELESRRMFGSPPYGQLVKLTVALEELPAAQREGERMAERLRDRAVSLSSDVRVLGPAAAYVARRGGRWRFHVLLRGTDPLSVLGDDPGPPWSIDVDPESVL